MKRTQKRVVGLLGLALVVVMTIFAALLPAPGTQAQETTSVTDTISVKVIGEKPKIDVEGIKSGDIFTTRHNMANVVYEDIEYLTITLKYTDKDGNVKTEIIKDHEVIDPSYGELPLFFDFESDGFGYGDYVLEVIGTGYKGAVDIEIVKFSFIPVYGEATSDGSDGTVNVDLNYDKTDEGHVAKVVVEVYDLNGNLIRPMSPITVLSPQDQLDLNFADYGLEPGWYRVKLTSYDENGNKLYKPYDFYLYYKGIEPADVPNTGQMFQNLNISQTDYLVTGLMFFGIVAVAGIVFVARKERKSHRK